MNFTTTETGPSVANVNDRVRQILAEALERMMAENIPPNFIFLALLSTLCTMATSIGEERAFTLAIRHMEDYPQK